MKLRTIGLTAFTLLALTVQPSMAMNSAGYNHLIVPADSDVLLTAPFTSNSVGSFTVSTVTASGVTVSNTFSVNAFANSHFVRMTSGTGEGLWSTISSNTGSELVLEDTNILSSLAGGDTFEIFRHETLESMFPDNMEGVSFEESVFLFNRVTEVLIPDSASVDINKPASATYFYFNNEWRRVGSSPTESFNNTIIPPQVYFILRNGGSNELKFLSLGQNAAIPVARILPVNTIDNDIPAGTGFPVPVTLSELNLGGTPAFTTTTLLFNRQDELLVFDNTAAQINKSASATYFYFNNAWRRVGESPTTSFDAQVLDPGAAILIRKADGAAGSSIWFQPSPL